MNRIVKILDIKPADYQFTVQYREGQIVRIDLKEDVLAAKENLNAWFGALAEPSFFAQVKLMHPGVPVWPNEFDMCADAILKTYPTIGFVDNQKVA